MKWNAWFADKKHGQRKGCCTALVLSAHGLHIAQVDTCAGRPRVLYHAFDAHEIVDAACIKHAMQDVPMPCKPLVTLLKKHEYQTVQMPAPDVQADELKQALRWQLKDKLSYPVDQSIIDTIALPLSAYGGGHQQRLSVTACERTSVQRYVSLFHDADLDLDIVDTPSMAQRNVAHCFEEKGNSLMLLHVDDEGARVTMSCDGLLLAERCLEISLGQLRDADASLRAANVERMVLEVQRTFDYFSRQFHFMPIQQLLYCLPNDVHVEQEFQAALSMRVTRMDLGQVMDVSAVPALHDGEYLCHALPAIGAALRQGNH